MLPAGLWKLAMALQLLRLERPDMDDPELKLSWSV